MEYKKMSDQMFCDSCGALLEGKDVCPKCGHHVGQDPDESEAEVTPTEKNEEKSKKKKKKSLFGGRKKKDKKKGEKNGSKFDKMKSDITITANLEEPDKEGLKTKNPELREVFLPLLLIFVAASWLLLLFDLFDIISNTITLL